MKEQSDIIIVNYHGGFEKCVEHNDKFTEKDTKENQGSQLINTFDSIDILFSGHQHREIITKINNTIISQPLNNGQFVANVLIDTDTKEVIDYKLINSKENEVDTEVTDYFDDVNDNCNKYLDKVIYNLDQDLTIKDVPKARLEGHLGFNLLNTVFTDYMKSDISSFSVFDQAVGYSKDITIREIIMNYPFPNTLVNIKVSGKEIKEAIRQSYRYYVLENNEIVVNNKYIFPKKQHYNYDIFMGVKYEVIIKEEGNDVIISTINNEPYDEDKEYILTISNYRHTNNEKFPIYKGKEMLKESTDDSISILIEYFMSHKDIPYEKEINFKVSK